jgi:hypothetical protein
MLKFTRFSGLYCKILDQTRLLTTSPITIKYDSLNFQHKYDEKQSRKILDTINSFTALDLEK